MAECLRQIVPNRWDVNVGVSLLLLLLVVVVVVVLVSYCLFVCLFVYLTKARGRV